MCTHPANILLAPRLISCIRPDNVTCVDEPWRYYWLTDQWKLLIKNQLTHLNRILQVLSSVYFKAVQQVQISICTTFCTGKGANGCWFRSTPQLILTLTFVCDCESLREVTVSGWTDSSPHCCGKHESALRNNPSKYKRTLKAEVRGAVLMPDHQRGECRKILLYNNCTILKNEGA